MSHLKVDYLFKFGIKILFFIVAVGSSPCAIAGFINPNESACLQCKSGYYLNGIECVTSCPEGSVAHTGTKSCQSKQ